MASEATARNLLECMLLDTSVEPTNLPISLLKSITNNFSVDHQIGTGGFAVVYKGTLQNGAVAVKKLFGELDVREVKFLQEVYNMLRVKHANIVRFLGYCCDTQGIVQKFEGRNVMAEEQQRLLCFEFLPLGSLDKYISDASGGLQWRTRYQILRGICEGLQYLHQQRIVHLDLKPANILLDHNMVAKIADFGISKCFDEEQSRAGIYAPEYILGGEITLKSDIYSLGIIIIEIVTGMKGCPVVDNVLESWSIRFEASKGDIRLEPIRVCAEIGIECTDFNPMKRPDTRRIIERLDEMEHSYRIFVADLSTSSETEAISCVSELVDEVQSMFVSVEASSPLQRIISSVPKGLEETSCEILDIHPLELRFPWEANQIIRCPMTLTNRTNDYVGVWITPTRQDAWPDFYVQGYSALDQSVMNPCSTHFEMMEPRSTLAIPMTMNGRHKPPQRDTCNFEVFMIVMGSNKDQLQNLKSSIGCKLSMDNDLLKRVEELGGEVHRAILKAVICNPASCQEVIPNQQFVKAPQKFGEFIKSIDVHPIEPWILVINQRAYYRFNAYILNILNYETQKKMMVLEIPQKDNYLITSAKFIVQEQWFAAGDNDGWIHVYACKTKREVKKFQPYGSRLICEFAVHPTNPFLLTCSRDVWIKLWDWSKGWQCTRKFDNHEWPFYIKWNPLGTDTFAACCIRSVKVWEIRPSDPTTLLEERLAVGLCFWANSHGNFMATCNSTESRVLIWDMRTKECVHKLIVRGPNTSDAACHPTLPILVTTDPLSRTVCLWDVSRTYRVEKIFLLPGTPVQGGMVFSGAKGLTRLIVGCKEGISIIEINLPTLKTHMGSGGGN